tara:strand:- start:1216 stop:2187 length:972 start_codon:yes stop_codon:yes gene_type:complete
MVIIACSPCLASTLGPTALSVATVVGINSQKKKKKKKKNTKKKMKGGKKKNNLSKKIKKSCHDECEKVKKTFPTIMRKLGKQMGLDKKEIEKRIKEHNKHCEGNCIKLMKDKDIIKDIIKAMKGGSGYETQEDYEAMVREQNESMNEDRIRMIKQKQKEKERMNLELRRRLIRQEDMRKECDKLVRLLENKGVSKQVAEKHAQKMFEQKLQCDSGKINACNYCKDEYIKNLRTSKKRSKTPQVPVQALPKSKSKSKSRPRKTTRRRKGPPESIAMKLHAMGRTSKLKNLKKSLTKRSPPPPIRRSKSKSKLKKTKSTGGKRNK